MKIKLVLGHVLLVPIAIALFYWIILPEYRMYLLVHGDGEVSRFEAKVERTLCRRRSSKVEIEIAPHKKHMLSVNNAICRDISQRKKVVVKTDGLGQYVLVDPAYVHKVSFGLVIRVLGSCLMMYIVTYLINEFSFISIGFLLSQAFRNSDQSRMNRQPRKSSLERKKELKKLRKGNR